MIHYLFIINSCLKIFLSTVVNQSSLSFELRFRGMKNFEKNFVMKVNLFIVFFYKTKEENEIFNQEIRKQFSTLVNNHKDEKSRILKMVEFIVNKNK